MARFLYGVLALAKNVKDDFIILFSYLEKNQIWLNCLLDDDHFHYITK
jgi:hypothetical protein